MAEQIKEMQLFKQHNPDYKDVDDGELWTKIKSKYKNVSSSELLTQIRNKYKQQEPVQNLDASDRLMNTPNWGTPEYVAQSKTVDVDKFRSDMMDKPLPDAEGKVDYTGKVDTQAYTALKQKNLYGPDVKSIALPVATFLFKQTVGRAWGAIQALTQVESPIKGFMHPEKYEHVAIMQPILQDYGLDPVMAEPVGQVFDAAMQMAMYHGMIGGLKLGVDKSKQLYQHKQYKEVVEFKKLMTEEFVAGGMDANTAREAVDTLVWKQLSTKGFFKNMPGRIKAGTEFLRKHKGIMASRMRVSANYAKSQGFTKEWFRQAAGTQTQLGKIAGKAPVKAAVKAPVVSSKIENTGSAVTSSSNAWKSFTKAEAKMWASKTGTEFKANRVKAEKLEAQAVELYKQETGQPKLSNVQAVEAMKAQGKVKAEAKLTPKQVKDLESAKSGLPDPTRVKEVRLRYIKAKAEGKELVLRGLKEELDSISAQVKHYHKLEREILKNAEPKVTKLAPSVSGNVQHPAPEITELEPVGLEPVKKEIPVQSEQREPPSKAYEGTPLHNFAKRVYDQISATVDPTRAADKVAARAILSRRTNVNVLKFRIHQVGEEMHKLVPNPADREIITKYLEPGGVEKYSKQMTHDMRQVASIVREAQNKMGIVAKEFGVIKTVLNNYMKHIVRDPELTIDEVNAKIQWAMSTDKISKYVESKHPRVRTPEGTLMFPTIDSLEAAGYEVITKDAVELYRYTMMSEGVAVINAQLARSLAAAPYTPPKLSMLAEFKAKATGTIPKSIRKSTQPLTQIMSVPVGQQPPAGYRMMRKGVFTGRFASPEIYNPLSSIAEPAWGGKYLLQGLSHYKSLKFILPFYHGWNFARNMVQARGVVGGAVTFMNGVKALKDPERVQHALQMGINLFRINQMGGAITDEFYGKPGKWDLPGKMREALFCGMGDSMTMGLAEHYERVLQGPLGKGMTQLEKHEVISDTVNSLSGDLSPEIMSKAARDLGRVFLLARNWTYSNLRQGVGAFGSHPKYWSPKQRAYSTKMWAQSLARMFSYLYTGASITNYMTTRHAYGKGRFLHQNPKGKKLDPMIWSSTRTGREYYVTNWYGTLGDIIHWVTRDTTLANKMMPPIKELEQQIHNLDFYTGDKIYRDSDNFFEGLMHRVEHLFEMGAPAGIRIDKGKAVSPTHIRVLNMLGMSIGSAAYNQDALTQLYHFQEKKRYDTLGIDRQIYKKLMVGDHQGALDIIRETDRYTTLEGAVEAMKKFQNPAKALWANMGIKDKRTFLDTLSESDAVKFQEDIQEERIE